MELADGRLTGKDTVLAYAGSYTQDGDTFTATVTTRRYAPGQASMFGIDNVDLTLTGKSSSTIACCVGTASQLPGLTFEATLIPIDEVYQPVEQRSPSVVTTKRLRDIATGRDRKTVGARPPRRG